MAEPIQISLAAARVNAKLTQQEVAEKMRISKVTLIKWEKGITVPSYTNLVRLSKIYGIPIDNIFLPIETTLSTDL